MYLSCNCVKQPRVMLGYLGATAPAPPAVAPAGTLTPASVEAQESKGENTYFQNWMKQYLPTGQLPEPTNMKCQSGGPGQGVGTTALKIGGAGAGIASSIMTLSPATGPFAPVVAVAGAIVSVLAGIFGAHAKKQQQEAQILCAAVPAVNQALEQYDQALQSGQMNVSQYTQALIQLQQQFNSGTAPLLKTGNASDMYQRELDGLIQLRVQAAQQAAAATASASPLASVGIPDSMLPWLVVGGAAALLLL
jgi:hypothetical protein